MLAPKLGQSVHSLRIEVQRPATPQTSIFLAVIINIWGDRVARMRASEQDCVRAVDEKEDAVASRTAQHVLSQRTHAVALATRRSSAEKSAAE